MTATVKRRMVRAGGWGLAKRLIKPIPIIGSVFAVAIAGYEIRKKGLLLGVVHVGLDVTPVVGTAKNVIEIFTGDWIPDKPTANGAASQLNKSLSTPITSQVRKVDSVPASSWETTQTQSNSQT
jgi:hypothetical protein